MTSWCNNRAFCQVTTTYRDTNEFKPHSRFKRSDWNSRVILGSTRYVHDTPICWLSTGTSWRSQESSSKVEETIKNIKEESEEKSKKDLVPKTSKEVAQLSDKALTEKKKTIWQRVKAEMLHYYHGFRLLGLDMKVSAKLIWRVLQGNELSRREHRLVRSDKIYGSLIT